jgi:copper chaperone NosL
MKKSFLFVLFLLLPLSFVLSPVQGAEPPAGDTIKAPACPLCGMNRNKFNFSRTFIVYDDGSTFGGCSLHCAAIDMAVNIDKAPVEIWVGDYNTKKLIDAEKAFWVIGGKKMGVMTKRAKWAFGTKEAADKFIAQYGGKLSNFEGAAQAAYEDMYRDTRMIREKRKMKRMKMQQMKQKKS